jgi:putative transcriptional regulator
MNLPIAPVGIAKLRHELGLSQAQFAQLFGVHQMTVSKWERGRPPLATPTPYQTALMNAFGVAARGSEAEVQQQLKNILIGAGVVAAIFFLLSLAKK